MNHPHDQVVFKDENITVHAIVASIADPLKRQLLDEEVEQINKEPQYTKKYRFHQDFQVLLPGQQPTDILQEEPQLLSDDQVVCPCKKLKMDESQIQRYQYVFRKRWRIESEKSPQAHPFPIPLLSCVCYVCETPEIPGKFDSNKAKALGLKPGPAYRKLCAGQSVMNDAGIEVHPHQVIGPAEKGPLLAIVACPHHSLLEQVIQHPQWNRYRSDKCSVSVMVHMIPRELVVLESYKQFIASFGTKCQVCLACVDCLMLIIALYSTLL